jgi:chromate transport protein ChrA
MNEILLLIGAIVLIIVLSTVITRVKNPLRFYIRIVAGTLLLAFVWLSNEMKVPISIIVTAIVLYGLYKEYILLKAETAINSEGTSKERNT